MKILLTFDDYWKSYKLYSLSFPANSNLMRNIVSLAFIAMSIDLIFRLNYLFIGFLFLLIGAVLFIGDIIEAKMIWRSYKHPKDKLNTEIEITSDYISFKTDFTHEIIKWGYFKNYLENKDFILLIIATRTYFIIPKRLFSSIQETQNFIDFIKSRISKVEKVET